VASKGASSRRLQIEGTGPADPASRLNLGREKSLSSTYPLMVDAGAARWTLFSGYRGSGVPERVEYFGSGIARLVKNAPTRLQRHLHSQKIKKELSRMFARSANCSQMRTFAVVVSAAGLSAAIAWLPLPGIWLSVAGLLFYIPIFWIGAQGGPLPGLASGTAASLLCAFVTASRGDASWPVLLAVAPGFVLVGLLAGFKKGWPGFQPKYSLKGTDPWPPLSRGPEEEANFDSNPLAAIESAADLLADGNTPQPMRQELVSIIATECSNLSAEIKGLLQQSSRATAAQQSPSDISAIIDAVAREAEFVLGAQGIAVRKEIELQMTSVQGSPDQLRNLLMSLAIKATEHVFAGSELVLKAHNANAGVIVEVRIQGRRSVLRRAANRLFGYSLKASGPALAAAYDIVHRHGGTISVAAHVWKGLEFSVWLPLLRDRTYGSWQGAGRGGG